ncbi:MAG: tRNA delta(2)-isopentenylpyrophosphate transferase [uncultured bacterium]|nr:MAG: tRNA delta(2)-isopentenylpyrophosphate transferase [uncultured bacterium]
MDIGTGKVARDSSPKLKAESQRHNDGFFSEDVRHHLIDVAEPNEDFNVSHFKTLAEKKIEEILKRGKVPIICGGTNFWIDAVVKNTNLPEVAPNEKLREMLSKKSVEELFTELKKFDPERAENIDAKNKFRLIRAIEICEALGKVPKQSSVISNQPASSADGSSNKYEFLQIGITTERESLNKKIKQRLEERFNQGMIEEVENLNNPPAGGGVSWERLENFGLEYRWIARFLQEKISKEEMEEKLYFDSIHYAKRQMTWLKRNKEIIWIKNYTEAENEVAKFLA